MKENFWPLPAACGEKILSPLQAEFGDNFFYCCQQNAVKNFSPLKLQILQMFTANFNEYLKFTGNITEVSNRWRSRIRSCWHPGGESFEPVYGSFFFVRNPVNVLKKFLATKNRKSYKNSTLKDSGALR